MRPVIQIVPSKLDINLDKVGVIMLLLMWGLTVFVYFNLSETIPIHFNGVGQADGFGDKATILLLPAIATVLFVGITILNKYPHVFNYPVTITEENAAGYYTTATRLLRFLKLGLVIMFTLSVLMTYLSSIGFTNGIGRWFLPLEIFILMAPTAYFVIKGMKKVSLSKG